MVGTHADCLTVFNFNTYLLEVSLCVQLVRKPNLEERADAIAEWFSTLSPDELPDVLVLNEIYAYAAERMLRALACKGWSKNRPLGGNARNFMECDPESKFGFITQVVNSTGYLNPIKEGGVVILVRRGLELVRAEERAFTAKAGSDALSQKGFWAVKVLKQDQPYWVLGAHLQAWPGSVNRKVRVEQCQEMRAFVNQNVEAGGRVCFAGDMNTSEAGEDLAMLKALGGPGAPATTGEHSARGFWMKLDESLECTIDPRRNHYSFASEDDRINGCQCLDWVVAPGVSDRLATPTALRYQYVPVKSNKYMVSEAIRDPATRRGYSTDDLSDHYGVFAQLWFGAGSPPALTPVAGHRGAAGRLPGGLPEEVVAAVEQASKRRRLCL